MLSPRQQPPTPITAKKCPFDGAFCALTPTPARPRAALPALLGSQLPQCPITPQSSSSPIIANCPSIAPSHFMRYLSRLSPLAGFTRRIVPSLSTSLTSHSDGALSSKHSNRRYGQIGATASSSAVRFSSHPPSMHPLSRPHIFHCEQFGNRPRPQWLQLGLGVIAFRCRIAGRDGSVRTAMRRCRSLSVRG